MHLKGIKIILVLPNGIQLSWLIIGIHSVYKMKIILRTLIDTNWTNLSNKLNERCNFTKPCHTKMQFKLYFNIGKVCHDNLIIVLKLHLRGGNNPEPKYDQKTQKHKTNIICVYI